jgi:hypothetical protein
MARYQVALIRRPADWQPETPDDVPPGPGALGDVIAESDAVFDAVRQAIAYNEAQRSDGTWAVVIDPETAGCIWPATRLCTPLAYKITSIWWPEGWEPTSAHDVPNCVWKARSGPAEPADNFRQAESSVVALNTQCMNQPGTTWYVVVAVENEPISRTIAFDSTGAETTTEVRRLHVIRPEKGGHGNCDHCPAHSFSCAQADWSTQVQNVTATQSRTLRSSGR